jgi:hypothetical protein
VAVHVAGVCRGRGENLFDEGELCSEYFFKVKEVIWVNSINGWSFFGLGSVFQFENQGIGISVCWGRRGKVATSDSDIVIVICGGGGGFLGTCQCPWLELLQWRTCCCVCTSLVEMTMLLLLGLWGQLADMQDQNQVEFVSGEGDIDALNLFLLVVKHGDLVISFFNFSMISVIIVLA